MGGADLANDADRSIEYGHTSAPTTDWFAGAVAGLLPSADVFVAGS